MDSYGCAHTFLMNFKTLYGSFNTHNQDGGIFKEMQYLKKYASKNNGLIKNFGERRAQLFLIH